MMACWPRDRSLSCISPTPSGVVPVCGACRSADQLAMQTVQRGGSAGGTGLTYESENHFQSPYLLSFLSRTGSTPPITLACDLEHIGAAKGCCPPAKMLPCNTDTRHPTQIARDSASRVPTSHERVCTSYFTRCPLRGRRQHNGWLSPFRSHLRKELRRAYFIPVVRGFFAEFSLDNGGGRVAVIFQEEAHLSSSSHLASNCVKLTVRRFHDS